MNRGWSSRSCSVSGHGRGRPQSAFRSLDNGSSTSWGARPLATVVVYSAQRRPARGHVRWKTAPLVFTGSTRWRRHPYRAVFKRQEGADREDRRQPREAAQTPHAGAHLSIGQRPSERATPLIYFSAPMSRGEAEQRITSRAANKVGPEVFIPDGGSGPKPPAIDDTFDPGRIKGSCVDRAMGPASDRAGDYTI